MNRKISLGAALALMLVITAVTFSVTMIFSRQMFNSTTSNLSQREAMYEKLAEIDQYVRSNYSGTIDEDALNDSLAAGYMAGLGDSYAAYYSAEEYAALTQSNQGSVVGIGISAAQDESGYIRVEEVYPDSPAEQAGIQVGSLIIKVNDIDVTADTYSEAINAISGKAGTKLSLVVRNGSEDTEIPEVTRRSIQRPTVYTKMYSTVGYLKITEFNLNTYDQFKKALDEVMANGATSLVFDVRNNYGGSIDSVIKILDLLLPEGDIATATYKDGRTEVLGTSDASCINLPMVVLTNKNTASSSELFTQALRDYGVAKSVGETTYGKGVMQVTEPLKDGSAIRLTIAKCNPPKSPNFDGVGIQPDYEITLTEDQAKMLELVENASDPQLDKALELLKSNATSTNAQPAEQSPSLEESTSEEDTSAEDTSSEESSDENTSEDSSSEENTSEEETTDEQ